MLANFGQHDVGDAGVATGRGGFSLPTLELPTISQHRLVIATGFVKLDGLNRTKLEWPQF